MGDNSETRSIVVQIYALLVSIFAAVFLAALFLDPAGDRGLWLDLAAKILGPLTAASVAWLGVNHTVVHSRRLEVLKEWHAELRWACKLCYSDNEGEVRLGIALLDSLDDSPELGDAEQDLIDAALKVVLEDDV